VLGWLRNNKKMAGWFALSLEPQGISFAHGRHAAPKSAIGLYGTRAFGAEPDLAKLAHSMQLARYDCTALLRPGDYQLLLVEAPNVSKEELKSAIRWRIKDMIDYHVDDATIDVLDIPHQEASAARGRTMYAVSARNELIQSTIQQCEQADIALSVIDITETAQRNIAALYESGDRAMALLYLADDWGLVTINYRHELYLARRFDIGLKEIPLQVAGAEAALERISVEIQRTLDHFDRQFRSIPVERLLVAPTPRETSIAGALQSRIGVQARDVDLREALLFDGEGPDNATQWRLFHHFGAALRHETKAL